MESETKELPGKHVENPTVLNSVHINQTIQPAILNQRWDLDKYPLI